MQKNNRLKKWSKTFNLLFVVPHKGDPKSTQIDFYKILTLVSGYERFMLVEAWLKVLIVLMSLLFVV